MSTDSALPTFIHYGTNAQRLAFTPAPPSTQPLYLWYESDTDTLWAYTTGWHQVSGAGGGVTASGTLTANNVILGSGSSVVKALGSLGTTTTLLHGNAGGAPTFAAVSLTADVSGVLPTANGGTGLSPASLSALYVNLQDQKTQNTAGGTFTSGSWQTRTLNTKVNDVGSLCTLSSNQFTLSAGTYIINAVAPAYLINARHQTRIQYVTDATTLLVGTSIYAPTISANICVTTSQVRGMFTVAASKALELQHQCQSTEATDGFGVAANFTTEVYSVVELWKIG